MLVFTKKQREKASAKLPESHVERIFCNTQHCLASVRDEEHIPDANKVNWKAKRLPRLVNNNLKPVKFTARTSRPHSQKCACVKASRRRVHQKRVCIGYDWKKRFWSTNRPLRRQKRARCSNLVSKFVPKILFKKYHQSFILLWVKERPNGQTAAFCGCSPLFGW